MAKKNLTDDGFSFFRSIKTGDRHADANIKHPDYGFIDTGSYALNALASGDLFGGFPKNKFIMAVGRRGTGKSYLAKNNFAKRLMDEGYFIFHWDTEGETTEYDLEHQNGYNDGQYKLITEATTVEQWFISVNGVIDQIEAARGDKIDNMNRCAFVLDSQGQLSTNKAINDATKGELKQDMTKAKTLAGAYRSITNRCANLGIPMFITNHVYLDPGVMFGNPEKIAGGESAQYSASIILSLMKTYEKTKEGAVSGVVLKATILKSRMVKDKMSASIYLDYEKGLDRYYGLQSLALSAGLIDEYKPTKYPDLEAPREADGSKTRKKCYVIRDPNKDPSQWIVCKESRIGRRETIGTILEPLNEFVKKEYGYRPPSLGSDDDDGVEISEEAVLDGEQQALNAIHEELESKRQQD